MRFFRSRVFAAAGLASLMMYSALFGALFLITQLLQTGLGATPLQAGLRTLPMAVMPLLLAPAGGVLVDRVGFRPLMIGGLAAESVALGWLAATVRPDVSYGLLVAPLALAGAGAAVFFAPVASATLSSVAPEEHGQASGAATAIRELAVVLGVAVLGLVFAGHGGYASRADFVGGFVPAMWLAAGLAAAGVLAAVALPRARVGEYRSWWRTCWNGRQNYRCSPAPWRTPARGAGRPYCCSARPASARPASCRPSSPR
jgi:MFS family permease